MPLLGGKGKRRGKLRNANPPGDFSKAARLWREEQTRNAMPCAQPCAMAAAGFTVA